MEPRLNVIVATLHVLGVELSVRSSSQRRLMQDAIYLAQEVGVDFGYNFAWHGIGPYSTELADDYYEAARTQEATDAPIRPLSASFRDKLRGLDATLNPPGDVTREDWLALLASVHFLRHYADLTDGQVTALVGDDTRRLRALIPQAQTSLSQLAAAS